MRLGGQPDGCLQPFRPTGEFTRCSARQCGRQVCETASCAAQDWLDIDFAIKEEVDFIAVSFVKSADVIKNLKSYLNARATKVRPH